MCQYGATIEMDGTKELIILQSRCVLVLCLLLLLLFFPGFLESDCNLVYVILNKFLPKICNTLWGLFALLDLNPFYCAITR